MPYKHSGEIGDIWKHLPLCEILQLEQPIRYHETNSACAQYILPSNAATAYGIYTVLNYNNKSLQSSKYLSIVKENEHIQNRRYLGSPALAMRILGEKTNYFFHDIESAALQNVLAYAQENNLDKNISIFNGDSIHTVLAEKYLLSQDDFLLIDPYTLAASNEHGENYYDVLHKTLASNAKGLLWFGFDCFADRDTIYAEFKRIAESHNSLLTAYSLWQQSMMDSSCAVNPGVPGCGLVAFNLSAASFHILHQYLHVLETCYATATYCGENAALIAQICEFTH